MAGPSTSDAADHAHIVGPDADAATVPVITPHQAGHEEGISSRKVMEGASVLVKPVGQRTAHWRSPNLAPIPLRALSVERRLDAAIVLRVEKRGCAVPGRQESCPPLHVCTGRRAAVGRTQWSGPSMSRRSPVGAGRRCSRRRCIAPRGRVGPLTTAGPSAGIFVGGGVGGWWPAGPHVCPRVGRLSEQPLNSRTSIYPAAW